MAGIQRVLNGVGLIKMGALFCKKRELGSDPKTIAAGIPLSALPEVLEGFCGGESLGNPKHAFGVLAEEGAVYPPPILPNQK